MRKELPYEDWKDRLKGVPAFVIGNGPSLTDVDLSPLKDRFTIGVNRAFMLIDPTILLWQDVSLLNEHAEQVRTLEALKVARWSGDDRRIAEYRYRTERLDMPEAAWRNSGAVAFNLALLLGCAPVVLLGVDCCYRDGRTDFYGTNKHHHAATLPNCLSALDWIEAQRADMISCSDNDVLSPRMSLAEALEVIGDVGTGERAAWLEKLRA